ncbi:MAG: hypothetical protein LBQ11_00395, partial [Candidatus Nomurabacteria bacterium]|nr:hypothetical protein [Candidatus Nomurabacteria bacterium]
MEMVQQVETNSQTPARTGSRNKIFGVISGVIILMLYVVLACGHSAYGAAGGAGGSVGGGYSPGGGVQPDPHGYGWYPYAVSGGGPEYGFFSTSWAHVKASCSDSQTVWIHIMAYVIPWPGNALYGWQGYDYCPPVAWNCMGRKGYIAYGDTWGYRGTAYDAWYQVVANGQSSGLPLSYWDSGDLGWFCSFDKKWELTPSVSAPSLSEVYYKNQTVSWTHSAKNGGPKTVDKNVTFRAECTQQTEGSTTAAVCPNT